MHCYYFYLWQGLISSPSEEVSKIIKFIRIASNLVGNDAYILEYLNKFLKNHIKISLRNLIKLGIKLETERFSKYVLFMFLY